MSYIRSGSNPEGLYIIATSGDREGERILIYGDGLPGSSIGPGISLPVKVFHGVALRWFQNYGSDDVKLRGVTVDEAWIDLKTGKVRSGRDGHKATKSFRRDLADGKPLACVIRFRYKRRVIHMWRVTWAYIVQNVADREVHDLRRAERRSL